MLKQLFMYNVRAAFLPRKVGDFVEYQGCVLTQDIGPYGKGSRFQEIQVDEDSGQMRFFNNGVQCCNVQISLTAQLTKFDETPQNNGNRTQVFS